MTNSTTLEPQICRANAAHGAAPTLVPVSATRWRVVVDGRIIGHLDAVVDAGGTRFRASRFRRAAGSLIPLGDFFRRSDAIDALRYAA